MGENRQRLAMGDLAQLELRAEQVNQFRIYAHIAISIVFDRLNSPEK